MPKRSAAGSKAARPAKPRRTVAQEASLVADELILNGYISPHLQLDNPKQLAFLMLNALDVFYGGAGGGGKSYGMAAAALQYVHVPGYAALLVRKTRASMYAPGGLAVILQTWLAGTDARWDGKRNAWIFPNGASVTLGYLNDAGDLAQFKGAAYDFIGVDEGSEFTEHHLAFLFSRLRRLKGSLIPPRFRIASNPGGPGHDWLKARYIDPHDVATRITIRATMHDNPHLDHEAYNRSLDELERVDPIMARQIREGDWNARHGGSIFKRDWLLRKPPQQDRYLDRMPEDVTRVIQYWDLAGTEAIGQNDPDWTAGVDFALWPGYGFVWGPSRRRRDTWRAVKRLIHDTARAGAASYGNRLTVCWEDVGLAGKMATADLSVELAGFHFAKDAKTSKDSKRRRALPLSSQMEAGNLYFVRGPWLEEVMGDLEGYPIGAHDDYTDAGSGAYHKMTFTPGQGTIDFYREEAEAVLKAAGVDVPARGGGSAIMGS